eukprot:CAMPEP_0194287444 /NCGR_PEP_ID=MMETSP0169-20130528/34765_1 /TAXON_ID=218684 /ORGANISM="Corethron pennatum, Strain L29A3" /LENGTH=79 /DNA_ID=CAMNT_0039034141 /DNA_START=210 /DNA_END=446 /DNA_ORIENTATION=-
MKNYAQLKQTFSDDLVDAACGDGPHARPSRVRVVRKIAVRVNSLFVCPPVKGVPPGVGSRQDDYPPGRHQPREPTDGPW